MQKLKKMVAYADTHFEKPFLILGLVAMILIICYQTLYRYLITFLIQFVGDPSNAWMIAPFCDPLALKNTISQYVGLSVWSEETARYIFIWISYLAIPLAIRERSNIRVDIIYDRLSNRLQAASWVVVDLCLLILSGFMLFKGFEHVRMQIEIPQTTAALQIPYFIPYLILPVGFGLMVLRALEDLCAQVYRIRATDSLLAVLFTVFLFSPVFLFEQLNAIMLLFGYFIVLLFIGVPIAFSLGIASLMTVLGANTLPVDYLASVAFTSIDSFPIMAIPFFIAAGIFMGAGGLSHRLLALADEVVGGLSGGIALASIATCMFFAAISGSGPATVAAIGALTIPAMVERGYDKYFSAALVAAAGCVGVMIPPSNPFVVYGISAQVSIGDLFMSGIVPGIMVGIVLMSYCYWYSRKKGWRGQEKVRNARTLMHAAWDAKWALMVPVIVLGGIYGGIMTPTEAAAIAAFYGLIVGLFLYKEMDFKCLINSCIESCETSAVIIVLMAMATLFGNIMTIEDVPGTVARAILSFSENKIVILMLINVLLLIVGTFMEALAAIVILVPILLPIVTGVGVSPLHFGVIIVVNLAIGFITPPVGVNLFVASGVAKAKLENIASQALPMIALMLIVLLICTYIPEVPLILVGGPH